MNMTQDRGISIATFVLLLVAVGVIIGLIRIDTEDDLVLENQQQAIARNDMEFQVENERVRKDVDLVRHTDGLIMTWLRASGAERDTARQEYLLFRDSLDRCREILETRWRDKRDSILGYWTEPPQTDTSNEDSSAG